ncbi:MAG: DUF1838 family protein [Gammaproteobacteria bacterium]|nr:DUF1838 family protein [Gammaproteobacteria bacterium]
MPVSSRRSACGNSDAGQAGAIDLSDPEQLFRAYRKLRVSLNQDPVFWWMRAAKFGVVAGKATPLYNMEIGVIFQVVADTASSFAMRSLEMVYTTDPRTGKRIDQLKSVYTGEMLPIKDVPVGPVTVEYFVDGGMKVAALPGSDIDVDDTRSGFTDGERVWITETTNATVTSRQAERPPLFVSDLPTYQGLMADLSNQRLASAPATVAFLDVSSWTQRMRMGERPGTMMTRGNGAKVATFADMPASYQQLVKEVHPEIYKDPLAALERDAYVFDR